MSLNKAFREIGKVKTSRSAFNLSCSNLSTHNMGLLYPVLCRFAMPGDKWVIDIDSIIRAMPLVYPAYVDIMCEYAVFFSPSRLLDDNFEEFITGGEDGDFSKIVPKIFDLHESFDKNLDATVHISTRDSVLKRLGLLPYNQTPFYVFKVSKSRSGNSRNYFFPRELLSTSLPLRAYYQIWDQYFRNENLQSSINFKLINSYLDFILPQVDDLGIFKDPTKKPTFFGGMLYVNWLKDYFTSALPFQQRGTAPIIPFDGSLELNPGVSGDVVLGAVTNLIVKGAGSNRYLGTDRNAWASGNVMSFTDYIGAGNKMVVTPASSPEGPLDLKISAKELSENLLNDVHTNVFKGLSVTDLRVAVQLQKFFERNARGGIRYIEFLSNHFNVSPSDSRLDRAEFIGGTRFPIEIMDVTSTSATEVSGTISDLGSYAGKAVSGNQSGVCVNYFVEEFGYIIVLFWIRPKTFYFQGFNREFQYSTALEYPLPEFMHLSEQGITNSEIYTASSTTTFDPTKIFGYQGIYDELRFGKNTISGSMALPSTKNTYFPWHLAQVYSDNNLPFLNSKFAECKPRADIFQIEDINNTPEFIVDHRFNIKCVRPMPIIGEPGLIDHF
nr:MAG: major capsid protein [Microvirus sp.]